MNDQPETLMAAVRYFSDLAVCNEYMRRIKWPRGRIVCPRCGGDRIGEIASRHLLRCKDWISTLTMVEQQLEQPTMSNEMDPLRPYYRIEQHGNKYHLYCKGCGQGWSLPAAGTRLGAILTLLNHAYSHTEEDEKKQP